MNHLQLKASNPESSAWVSASAGTGKTKILTDRVLRLVLKNTPFHKILCLTFTNAAAGEMKERVASALESWSRLNQEDLAKEVEKVTGSKTSQNEVKRAQNLYDIYLKSEEQINIHTIHSFCQKLLKKFPLEASISPNFKIIDNIKSHAIIQQIKKELYDLADFDPISHYFAENFHDVTIDEIFNEIIENRTKFSRDTDLLQNIHDEAKKIIDKLKKSDHQKYASIAQLPIIKHLIDFNANIAQIKSFFLTKDGEKRKRIVPAKIAKAGSSLYADLEEIQGNVYYLDQQEKKEHLENYSKLLSLKAMKILADYEQYKEQKNLLDYDDLIEKTRLLLTEQSAKEWVLYKLDGGIDHLLVDEAQDTSPMQWQIIEALIQEFYSGDSASDLERTIFVVGDEKQSIFSFQGADISSFHKMNKLIKEKLSEAKKDFVDINLETSYRSTGQILDVVDHVFTKIKKENPSLFESKLPSIKAHRKSHNGSVQLWPLCKEAAMENVFWPISDLEKIANSSKKLLAAKIAEFIDSTISSKQILASTGIPAKASDFMILFRRRNELTLEVIKAIKHKGLEVMGLDRIILSESLAVSDLISIAKFVLNPEDELNLAELLKSPIVNITEESLQKIALRRNKETIWQFLLQSDHYPEIVTKLKSFLDLYTMLDVSNFFHFICDTLGYREILNETCEDGSNDAIDELLYFSQNYAKTNDSLLQNFIFWFENYQISIKRDASNVEAVKIMTVHASKGLQSPFVILCDTTSLPNNNERFFWDKDGNLLSSRNSGYIPETFKEIKENHKHKTLQEYNRLLYVGMTRAEDHLIICGDGGALSLPDDCWYKIVQNSMCELAEVKSDDGILYYGSLESNSEEKIEQTNSKTENSVYFLPKNVIKFKESLSGRKLDDIIAISPLMQKNSMQYGLIFHKILEDAVKIKDLSMMYHHPLISTLEKTDIEKMNSSIAKIIANKEFIDLLKYDIKTEVSVGFTQEHLGVKIGRIDLVAIAPELITIIDYKSDSNPPKNPDLIPSKYKQQLAFYQSFMQKIFPTKTVISKILWLETGGMM